MNKTRKITINILVFALIAGFGFYMIYSMMSEGEKMLSGERNADDALITPYKIINRLSTTSDIIKFDIYENTIYAAQSGKISVFDLAGKHQHDFPLKNDIRDIIVRKSAIYLLYPTGIEVFTMKGEKIADWDACSDNSDYCAFSVTDDYVFVTDAENKLITQFDQEGQLVRFIKSPAGFIIPSYSFDIIVINDTIYCSNSGRHTIETYTLEGEYITSFGTSGMQAGAFAGCCNPVYLAATPWGDIVTSEKGNPRISCYGQDGKFRSILLNSKVLGGGTEAYSVKMEDDKIYVAASKYLSVFVFDPELAAQSACADCPLECPLKQFQ